MTVSFRLKAGEGPEGHVHVRLSHQGTRRYLSTGLSVKKKWWNASEKRARPACPHQTELNARLHRIREKATQAVRELEAAPKQTTLARAKEAVRSALAPASAAEGEDFIAYAMRELQEYQRRGQHGTFKSYRCNLRKFKRFVESETGQGTLAFDALTTRLLRRFRTYCYEERGNKPNTVGKALKVLRTFCRKAIDDGHIPREEYPFRHIQFDSEEVDKDLLRPEEIEAIAAAPLPEDSTRAEHRRWFLWAYYTAGMRFSDVATLQPKHLKNGRVFYRMEKESKSTGVPVTEKAQSVLDYYDSIPATEEGWVFPILSGYGTGETTEERYVRKETQNKAANESLVSIAEEIGLEKRVTFHLSRNAALWRLYQETEDIYMVSKIAGHANVEQTQAYIDGFQDETYDEVVRGAL